MSDAFRSQLSVRGTSKKTIRRLALAGATAQADTLVQSLAAEDENEKDPQTSLSEEESSSKRIKISPDKEFGANDIVTVQEENQTEEGVGTELHQIDDDAVFHYDNETAGENQVLSDSSDETFDSDDGENESDDDFYGSGKLSDYFNSSEEVDVSWDPVVQEMTRKKSLRLLSTAYYLRHGLSKAALKDFLTLMNIAGENLPKEMRSPFTLLNPYTHLKSDIRRIYVCRKCKNLLVNGQDGYPIKLQPCGHPYARVKKHCYTLLLNIEDQLAYFLKHYGMKRRNSEDGKIGDVASGSCYKELMNQLGEEAASRTITLQVNTDGAQMYESSKWNFWPFMVIINEAPYHIRRENMVLVGIHHCDSKPTEDAFVLPCVERLKMLQENGIEFENNHYNVRLLIVTTDTVARPIIRNTTQFNGKFGCDFCLHPGYSVKRGAGNRGLHVYCERNNVGILQKFPLRTMEQHLADVQAVLKMRGKDPRVNGIKGTCALLEIQDFDFIKAFTPDYMHSMCIGVIKMYVLLWITNSKENKGKPWYIGDKLQIINSRLRNVLPPLEITRTPSEDYLQKTAFWKAHEFKAFCLYYFTVLDGILPEPYFSHFALLSHGLYILLQEEVDLSSVQEIAPVLDYFVAESEALYGRSYTTYNLHLTTHLSKSSLDWGSLWASSTFLPEWFNGELQSMVHGTQAPVEQMASTFLIRNAVRDEVIEMLKDSTILFPRKHLELFQQLIHLPTSLLLAHGIYPRNRKLMGDQNALLGSPIERNLSSEEMLAIFNLIQSLPLNSRVRKLYDKSGRPLLNPCPALFFPKFQKINGTVFTTTAYSRSPKRSNYCALMEDSNFVLLQSFVVLPQICDDICFVLGHTLGSEYKSSYIPAHLDIESSDIPLIVPQVAGQMTKLVGTKSLLSAYLTTDVKKKCVIVMKSDLNDSVIAVALANSIERD